MTPRARKAASPEDDGRMLSVATVARRLGYTAATIRYWIRDRKIAVVKSPTGRYRIPASELDRLLQINPQESQTS